MLFTITVILVVPVIMVVIFDHPDRAKPAPIRVRVDNRLDGNCPR
jgi:hypothetical protein